MNPRAVNVFGRAGFTLIELMVVMLLISIILAVAIPRFEGGLLQDPQKKMARWMINTVRSLRATAIQKQSIQSLVVDVSNHKLWLAHQDMSEEERDAASQNAFEMPNSINLIDIQFPGKDPITSGTVEVLFYPVGYSDHVLMHLENDQTERFSYRIEPLLPKMKIIDEWIDF